MKRRRVLSTCVYYLIGCWIVLQAGDILYPAIGLDADTASRFYLYIAILGFPVNFALAWYFQISPKGITRTTSFVERRVLRNIAPINDKRHDNVATYFHKQSAKEYNWIISAETGTLTGLSFGISGPIELGRSLECGIAVVSPEVSRRHARLFLDDNRLMVEDLGSANGTVVNGKKIPGPHALHHEDELRLHDVIFRVTESYAGQRAETDSLNQTTLTDSTPSVDPPEPS